MHPRSLTRPCKNGWSKLHIACGVTAILCAVARHNGKEHCGVGMTSLMSGRHHIRQVPWRRSHKTCRAESQAAGSVLELSKPALLQLKPVEAVRQVALPAIAIGFLRTSYSITDAFWLGRCGPVEVEAVGAASFAVWLTLMFSDLGALGVHADGAASVGGGNEAKVGDAVMQGLHSAWIVGIVMACLIPFSPMYLSFLGISTSSAVGVSATGYLWLAFLGTFPLAVAGAAASGFKAIGEMRPVFLIMLATVVLNAVVDPVMIRGFGPIPRLGSVGAAHATNLAATLAAVFTLLALKRRGIPLRPQPPDWKALRRLFAIGAPITFSGITLSMVYLATGHIVSLYGGAAALGAMGIALKLEQCAFVFCEGYGIGAATIVGQWLGHGKVQPARKAAAAAYRSALLCVIPGMILLCFFPTAVVRIFTSDPTIVSVSASMLRVVAAVLPFTALDLVYDGAMTGAQNTTYSLVSSLLWNPLRVPLAIILSESGLGLFGIWLAIDICAAGRATCKWLAFRSLHLDKVAKRCRQTI